MGKRGRKVICTPIQPSILADMVIASRVDEDETASDEAAAEQTILGGREQTKMKSIAIMQDMRRTTMNSKSWPRTKSRSSGKPCAVTCQTASDSRAPKRNAIHIVVYRMD